MENFKTKLKKIAKEVEEKKKIQKKRDLEFKDEQKKSKKEIDKIWDQEFKNNENFIGSLNEMLSTFRKLDQNFKYEYIINRKDDDLIQMEFILENISVEIRILIVHIKIANIQIYVNWDTNSRAIIYDPQHLKSFKLNDAAKAKDFYLNKILEIFKDLQS